MNVDLDTVLAVENGEDEDGSAIQKMINAGAWSFQGSVGRTMMEAIEAGAALLGKEPAQDYWGNFIPSRDMVVPGTKGSYEYVVEHSGKEHADRLAAL